MSDCPPFHKDGIDKTNIGISGCTPCNLGVQLAITLVTAIWNIGPSCGFAGHFGFYNLRGEQVNLAPLGCIVFFIISSLSATPLREPVLKAKKQ